MCYRAERSFVATSRAPKDARIFCIDHVGDVLSDIAPARDVIDDAATVVSELVTNAVTAEATRIVATLVVHRTHLMVSVYDDAEGAPDARDPAPHDEHGRGLRVVDSYSLRWGVDEQGVGKQVWAMLAVPDEATTNMACNVYALV